jgi:hypothetical protein
MIICEFCRHCLQGGACRLGLDTPKAMSCREFDPEIEKFCADPNESVSPKQIVQTATFFGIQRMELKKVKLMAAREESRQ